MDHRRLSRDLGGDSYGISPGKPVILPRREAALSFEQNYSSLDRIVHRLAFSSRAVQLAAADVEISLWGDHFQHIPVKRPIFITSLPRAGTTLLLNILSQWPGLASHCYRDMPFVLAPLLWDRLSGPFRKPAVMMERAHSDGLAVGYDSPEAFEEVVWRVQWPEKYSGDGVLLWSDAEEVEEFRGFFVEHMQKIIVLRSPMEMAPSRYISKNNNNIARIGLLKRMFPNGVILIPFRHPVDQAASLQRQHRNFLALHRREPFSKRYMNDIGHLEFGELHRPFRFEGIDELLRRYRPDSLDYWLGYWVAAFEHIARHKEEIVLISYEKLCENGEMALRRLMACLKIEQSGSLESSVLLKAPTSYNLAQSVHDKDVLDHANELYHRLLEASFS